MKRSAKTAVLTLAVAAFSAFAIANPAIAREEFPGRTDYRYTLTVSGGNLGDYETTRPYEMKGLKYGEQVELDASKVTLKDDHYFVKGFRLSGQDALLPNEDGKTTITVTEDTQVVAAYGVKGAQTVKARVNFVEYGTNKAVKADNGKTYLEFEGLVGDKFMVPFEYAKDYRPRYTNLTGTLKESGNEWKLEYVPVDKTQKVIYQSNSSSASSTQSPRSTSSSSSSTSGGRSSSTSSKSSSKSNDSRSSSSAGSASSNSSSSSSSSSSSDASSAANSSNKDELLDVTEAEAKKQEENKKKEEEAKKKAEEEAKKKEEEGSVKVLNVDESNEADSKTPPTSIANDAAPSGATDNNDTTTALVVAGVAAAGALGYAVFRNKGDDDDE